MNKAIKEKNDVERFLRQFLPKMNVFGIIFIDRDKTAEAMRTLGITVSASTEIVKSIEANDYIETIIGAVTFGDMWVFGKDFDGTELYIKISLGRPSNSTICISFHKAEWPLKHAFKEDKK